MAARIALFTVSLTYLLILAPLSAFGDTCVDYDEPYELLGEFERGMAVTAITLDAPMSMLHLTYSFPCCEGYDTGSRTVVVDVSDPENTVFLDVYERPGSDPPEPLANVTADGGVVCGFVTDGELPEDILHMPAGLDIGGSTPDEIAVSVVSEMQAVRYGRSGHRHMRDR